MRTVAHLLGTALAGTTLLFAGQPVRSTGDWSMEVTQLTRGPLHHFFGYIGHVRTIPWSGDGRYVLALRTSFQDRMPEPGEPADIVLIDTRQDNLVVKVEQSRGWNFQQGTMFYWNPEAPETQFFFNDRDPVTGKLFTVLYDITTRTRVREFRFDDTPVANGGVAQNGGRFLALNYGRMARLRPVTGYPGAFDYTGEALHPADDGVHVVDVKTGTKRLLVSFAQLADLVRTVRPDVVRKALFVNHSLWNRDDDRVYFYVRGEFDDSAERIDIPCTIKADGTGLTMLDHVGGHPEWESGSRMIGVKDDRQVIYDVATKTVVGTIGAPEVFPQPGGDIALSPDARWFVNGHSDGGFNQYTVLRLADGTWGRTPPMSRGAYRSGNLRIDGAPAWNRTSDAIAFPSIDPSDGTRQTFVMRVRPTPPADTPLAPSLAGLGSVHHPVTTTNADAQRFFDQGLRLLYGFNHPESLRAFQEAARLDPSLAMAYWGQAMALSPNLNVPMTPENGRVAFAAIGKARTLARQAAPVERALIEALATRLAADGAGDAAAHGRAYADAMTRVAASHSSAPDVQTLLADALLNTMP